MNPDTNHLIDKETYGEPSEGYVDIPEDLNRAARRKLAGKSETKVSFISNGKLSKWARQQRKNRRVGR